MSPDPARYGLDELAELGGVSRRTVRYYIQEGLLPAPFGVGRGPHYGPEHLDALREVKALQEAGHTLDSVRQSRSGALAAPRPEPAARTVWRRLTLASGLELHVRGDVRLPPGSALEELAEWCRVHFVVMGDRRHADD
jgi:DNA-binding transcriptional MerR regulator